MLLQFMELGSPKNRIFWDFNDTRSFFPLMISMSSKFGLVEDVFFNMYKTFAFELSNSIVLRQEHYCNALMSD